VALKGIAYLTDQLAELHAKNARRQHASRYTFRHAAIASNNTAMHVAVRRCCAFVRRLAALQSSSGRPQEVGGEERGGRAEEQQGPASFAMLHDVVFVNRRIPSITTLAIRVLSLYT